MENEKMVKCLECGEMVPERMVNRFRECKKCEVAEKNSDMCVGDLNTK